jgi:anti-anti-sigma factor
MDHGMVGTTGRDRLQVTVRQSRPGSAVVTPAGELDHHTADLLREPLERLAGEGVKTLVVDCGELSFCDSTGLNVLLGARLKAEAEGGTVHLAALRSGVARVLEITGASSVFAVHATVEDALQG